MTTTQFPLDLDNARNIQALIIGLEDENVRIGIRKNEDSPRAVIDLIEMIEDENFLERAGQIINTMQKHDFQPGELSSMKLAVPTRESRPEMVMELEAMSTDLRGYLNKTYPDGMGLLKDYQDSLVGQKMLAEAFEGTVGANAWVAANVAAVVNAVAWSNAAVATMAVAALAVFAVVA